MSNAPSVKDILQGGGAPTASFDERQPPTGVGARPGLFYEGRVVKEEIVQATKMAQGGQPAQPEFWDPPHNTRPKWQVILTVENPQYVTAENEQGHMRLFLKGGALQAAQKKAKELGIETFLHGFARLTWTGTQPAKTAGYNDSKVYDFQFQPGVAPAHAAVIQGQQGGAPQAPQQQFPQQQFAPPPVPQQQPLPGFQPPVGQPGFAQQPQQQFPPQQAFNPPLPGGAVSQGEGWAPAGAPQVGGPAAPPQQQFAAGADAVQGIMGGVEVTPLDPMTKQQVEALIGAGMRDASQIVAAFQQHGLTPPSTAQVQAVIDNTPF